MTNTEARTPPTDEQYNAINKQAHKSLERLLKTHENTYGDKDHEWEFIGDLFARMILASYMGYSPEELGQDAEAAGERIIKLAGAEK